MVIFSHINAPKWIVLSQLVRLSVTCHTKLIISVLFISQNYSDFPLAKITFAVTLHGASLIMPINLMLFCFSLLYLYDYSRYPSKVSVCGFESTSK